jgi:hypothetical protein
VSYPLRGFRPHDKELVIPHYVESCAAGGRLFHFISIFIINYWLLFPCHARAPHGFARHRHHQRFDSAIGRKATAVAGDNFILKILDYFEVFFSSFPA